jgi:hypothetical protein
LPGITGWTLDFLSYLLFLLFYTYTYSSSPVTSAYGIDQNAQESQGQVQELTLEPHSPPALAVRLLDTTTNRKLALSEWMMAS